MKNYLVILLLGFSFAAIAQDNKITFDYDTAGNQIRRELCLSCTKANYKTKAPKEVATLVEEDLQKFSPEDSFSFYPNPVKEELYLKWEYINGKAISSIQLYDLNGRLLKSYDHLEKQNTLTIPFFNYPQATYLVMMLFSDGEQKTIKIVK